MLVSFLFLWTAIFFVWRCSIDRPSFMLVRLRLKKTFLNQISLQGSLIDGVGNCGRFCRILRLSVIGSSVRTLPSRKSFPHGRSCWMPTFGTGAWRPGGPGFADPRINDCNGQCIMGNQGTWTHGSCYSFTPKMRLFYMKNYGKWVKCWFSRSEACRNGTGPRRQTKMALGNWSTTEKVVPRPLPSIMDLWFWRQLGSTKIAVSCHFSRINKPGRVVR